MIRDFAEINLRIRTLEYSIIVITMIWLSRRSVSLILEFKNCLSIFNLGIKLFISKKNEISLKEDLSLAMDLEKY